MGNSKLKIPKEIYIISKYNFKVKVAEILSKTKLPNGSYCFEIKDFGYCIFPSNNILDKGESRLCYGLEAFKGEISFNSNPRRRYLLDQIAVYSQMIEDYQKEIKTFESKEQELTEFVKAEEDKINLIKAEQILQFKNQKNVSTEKL